MKEIVIDVTDDGDITIETRGFTGKSCIHEAQFIKDLIGTEITRNLTPAYFKTNQTAIKKYLPLCG